MTLVLENGSGVSGANAYVDAAYVTTYLTDRGRQAENSWSTASAALQAASCIAGTDHVENRVRQALRGSKEFSNISTARSTLTLTAVPGSSETVVVGSVTYTFVASPASPNDVDIGATVSESIDNLVAAILADSSQAGTAFGTGTVENADATATAFIDDTMVVLAKALGTAGSGVATTTTVTGGSWNFATTVGGSDIVRPQPLSFPRIGLYDRDGNPIIGVPERLKYATSEYSVRARAAALAPDPTVDDYGGTVQSLREKVGPIETETAYVSGTAGSGTIPSYPAADRLLSDYLRPAGVVVR